MKKIEYLVGNKNFKSISRRPYNDLVCNFICELSKILINHSSCSDYPDIKTLAFWCRKKNIDILKSNFSTNQIRVGLGLVFHITHFDVLIFGLTVVLCVFLAVGYGMTAVRYGLIAVGHGLTAVG